jgi:hypothetical protein
MCHAAATDSDRVLWRVVVTVRIIESSGRSMTDVKMRYATQTSRGLQQQFGRLVLK